MKKLTVLILTAALAMTMTACGGSTDKQADQTEVKEPEYRTIGIEAEGAMELLLTNDTGSDITSLVIRSSEEKEEKASLLGDDTFVSGETRQLYYAPAEATEAEDAGEENADEKLTYPEYTVTLKLADDTKLTFHQFPMEDAKEVSIRREEAFGYLEYRSEATGDEINTLEEEKELKAKADAEAKRKAKKAAEEKAKKEAEEKARAEAEAAAAAAAAKAAQQQQWAAQQQQKQQSSGGGGDKGCLGGNALTY